MRDLGISDRPAGAVALPDASRAPPAAPPKTRLSSVAAAFRLLNAFSEEEVEIGVSALAKRLGLAKSTVHRLAVTLVGEGILEQNPENEKYRLGINLFRLGALVRQRMNLSNEAKPYLVELRELTGETVHLAILNQNQIMYVYNLESRQAIRARSDVGVRKPAYCTAEGLAMLAFQPDEVVEAVIAEGLSPRTLHTSVDQAGLRRRLAEIRQTGSAVEDEESEIGMRGIAAPVREASGAVVAAVGLAGPVQRLSKRTISGFVPSVVRTADAISARLGYRPGKRS
jgi:DNA-binding IclR family transcriptional regulator